MISKSKVDRSRDDTLDRRRRDQLSEPIWNFGLTSFTRTPNPANTGLTRAEPGVWFGCVNSSPSLGGGVIPALETYSDLGSATLRNLFRLIQEDRGQDIAEYAVMLATILVLVVGTVRLVGSQVNNAFSSVASALQ